MVFVCAAYLKGVCLRHGFFLSNFERYDRAEARDPIHLARRPGWRGASIRQVQTSYDALRGLRSDDLLPRVVQ